MACTIPEPRGIILTAAIPRRTGLIKAHSTLYRRLWDDVRLVLCEGERRRRLPVSVSPWNDTDWVRHATSEGRKVIAPRARGTDQTRGRRVPSYPGKGAGMDKVRTRQCSHKMTPNPAFQGTLRHKAAHRP